MDDSRGGRSDLRGRDDLDPTWSPRVRCGIVWQYRAQPAQPGVADYVPPKFDGATRNRVFSPELARPSSYHADIFHAAMLSGWVSPISNRVDYRVLQALMTPHGSDSDVPDPSYVLKEADPSASGR